MKHVKVDIKRSCLMSILVAGLAMPVITFGQDTGTQQTPSADRQNQQTDASSSQDQRAQAQRNQNQQSADSQRNQNQQSADSQRNQNQQQAASQRNQNQGANAQGSQNQQAGADGNQQIDLTNYANGSVVTLRGTVESVLPNTFTLSYNDGEQVTVEMDDGDRDADAYVLSEGDKVTVTGLVDRNLFERRTIEAGYVYVEKYNTWFTSSALDEEVYPVFATIVAIPDSSSGSNSSSSSSGSQGSSSSGSSSSSNSSSSSTAGQSSASENMPVVWLQGKVGSVSDNSLKLTMGDGNNEITVSTDNLSNNPLGDQGSRKIEQGDIVQVSGTIDGDFFESQELQANSIAKIHDRQSINQ